MTKLIKQIICSFIATVAVIGLTTGSANAQLAPSVNSVLTDTSNQVIIALDNQEEANDVSSHGCEFVVCKPGNEIEYFANPRERDSFCQCSNGVPIYQPCPTGLAFNPNLNVCDWPEN